MFGSTPGLFGDSEAASIVAKGYSMEEKNTWIVVHKRKEHFRPCRTSDLKEAMKDDWLILTEDQ